MSECLNCGDYSRGKPLCYLCWEDERDGFVDKCKCGSYKDNNYELCKDCYFETKKSSQRQKSKGVNIESIKGRIAEGIIEELFLSMGFDVFRFGMENTIPGFSDRYFPKRGSVAHKIRRMPDFVVVKDEQSYFLEVKYRKSGEFDFNKSFNKDDGEYPYPDAYFILVSPKHIKIQKAKNLQNGEDFIFLANNKDFVADRELILKYLEISNKIFQSLDG